MQDHDAAAYADACDKAYREKSRILKTLKCQIAQELGILVESAMGLTAPEIKADPRYQSAKQDMDFCFQRLRKANEAKMKARKKS